MPNRISHLILKIEHQTKGGVCPFLGKNQDKSPQSCLEHQKLNKITRRTVFQLAFLVIFELYSSLVPDMNNLG